jgi:hypothetical protein
MLAMKVKGTKARATWKAPAGLATKLTGYQLYFDQADPVSLGPTVTSRTFSGLDAGSEHLVQLVALTDHGGSRPASKTFTVPLPPSKAAELEAATTTGQTPDKTPSANSQSGSAVVGGGSTGPKAPAKKTNPTDPDLKLVTVRMNDYHGADQTSPAYCVKPRVWVDNKSDRYVTSVRVVFSTHVGPTGYDNEGLPIYTWGPELDSGVRSVQLSPHEKWSVPLKVCGKPSDLPARQRAPDGQIGHPPNMQAEDIVRFEVTLG